MRFNHIIAWVVLLGIVSTTHAVEEIPLVEFPAWGVAVCPPAEWGRVFTTQGKRMAHWQKVDGAGQPIAAVVIDAETVSDTLDANAEKWAKKYQMTSREITLAGERAIELTKPQQNNEHLDIIVLVMRGKILYQISGFSNDGKTATGAVIFVQTLWKWIDRKPLAESIEMSKPIPAIDGGISLSVPKSSYLSTNKKELFAAAMYDVTRNVDEYRILVWPMTREAGEGIDKLTANVIQYETLRKKTEPQPVWRKIDGPTPRMMTQPIVVITPEDMDEDGPIPEFRITKMFAVIEVNDTQAVKIVFNLSPEDEKQNEKFVAAAEKIVGSMVITDATKFPQPKASPATKKIDAVSTPATPVQNFPTWGAAFAPPTKNWQMMMNTVASRMATWQSGTPGKQDYAVISIYVNNDKNGDLEAQVKEWQKNFHGDRVNITLGGEPAAMLTNLTEYNGSKPEIVVTTVYKNVTYSILATVGASRSAKSEVSEMCKSWKWIPREPIAKHMDVGGPVPALDGRISLFMQTMAYLTSKPDDKTKFSFRLFNVETFADDFAFSVYVVSKKAGVPVEQFSEGFVDDVRKNYQTDPMPFFKPLNGPTPRFVTQPFFITIPEQKNAEGKLIPASRKVVMYGFVGFEDKQVLMIAATLTSPSLNDNVDFLKAVEKMIESITVVGKK